jgi:ribosomal protein L40E
MLKKFYSEYKVIDATKNSIDEILKLTKLYKNSKNVLIYVGRGANNILFFKTYETVHKCKEKIQMIFSNNDNYIYFENADNIFDKNGDIKLLRKFLDRDTVCTNCFATEYINAGSCKKCGSIICYDCAEQLSCDDGTVKCRRCGYKIAHWSS